MVALDLADLIGMKNQHPNRRTLQLEKASHRLNRHIASENPEKQQRLLRSMSEYPADGILICATQGSDNGAGNLEGRLPPIVAFTRPISGVDFAGV